jgi:uncharacterized protein involved in exopolysaccharide biosynthesis
MESTRQETEISFIQILGFLWEHRRVVAVCTLAITLVGALYAFLAPPVYTSQASIALKDGKGNDASRLFSQLGGAGSLVASQLGGNTNLEKLEVILRSHEVAESVIRKNDLLPVLFPDKWDPAKRTWKSNNPERIPTVRRGVELLRGELLHVSLDTKKSLIRLGADARTPEQAKMLVDFYLVALNDKIRTDVMMDASSNRQYLESQLNNTRDPILIETIQNMIGYEIEKYMLVTNRSFDILERPVVPLERSKPKKKMVIMLAMLLGLVLSSGVVLIWKGPAAFKRMKSPPLAGMS